MKSYSIQSQGGLVWGPQKQALSKDSGAGDLFRRAALVAQMVKNLPAMRETQVRSLGQEDTLEKGMATHSSTLAWRVSWTEEPWRATVHGVTKSQIQMSDVPSVSQEKPIKK